MANVPEDFFLAAGRRGAGFLAPVDLGFAGVRGFRAGPLLPPLRAVLRFLVVAPLAMAPR
ncbi:hypothetical protein AVL48_33295 [Amycolatopsis regifaucium]|uniref:Uncharacterized protein n=1 Tax=Amycolatopsis regifaucium TaxID=546365 RepID=A0A154MKW9_9PSEU|nr:hypothetical protein AVL48_33295 [Amycolatopsis regifaucium]OKA11117.1 hypothetical protein ATP06_0202960 [Amycolatopsis regifaucium]